MKKILMSLLACFIVIFGLSCCCSETSNSNSNMSIEEKPKINENINKTIYEDENIKFVVKDKVYNEFWDSYDLEVYLENNTSYPVMFSWDNVSVNGYMIDPFWASEVSAGKKENCSISFPLTSLSENNISDIENIEFTLRAYTNSDNLNGIYLVEDIFTLKF